MGPHDTLERGRAAFRSRAWASARALLSEADGNLGLDPEDLELLADAASLTGHDAESAEYRARAHRGYRERGEIRRAIRAAFWLALRLFRLGERERGGGWLARASRMLEEAGRDCPECGLLLLPAGIEATQRGNAEQGYALFSEAAELAAKHGDADLGALARMGQGRALIRLGKIEEGVELLDEAMADAESGEVSPLVVGDVYCTVIEACQEIFDLRRAQAWTEALTEWCGEQPDLVPYRGQCQVRRAEILQIHGAWSEALEEARRACERLAEPPAEPAAGEAFYQRAELHRLRGEVEEAEACYRESARWIRRPRPGQALLRLQQGEVQAAAAAVRRALDESSDSLSRARVLPAMAEIMLAAGDLAAAHLAVNELDATAGATGAALLKAAAAQWRGAVLLREGDAEGATAALRGAWSMWSALQAPYEAARVRVLLGEALRAGGDDDGAEADFAAARLELQELGAVPALRALDAAEDSPIEADHTLTRRELEVLRLIATGESNRSIAETLFISERTVERHVSNIFDKLDVSSRTAAAAYAFERGLMG